MKTRLQKELAEIAPNISIETIWEHDPDSRFSEYGATEPGGCFENEDPDDWQCWQSEIRASVISGGEIVTGSAYLGGTWVRAEDIPWKSDPDIGGYELQMTQEALQEMPSDTPHLQSALDHVRAQMTNRYEAQHAEV